jgi:small subunit ribosomal protein S9
MAEKKTTTKKPAVKAEKKEEKIEEVKTPVVDYVAPIDPEELLADKEIEKEIAQSIKDASGSADRYFEAIGRRKTAVARIRLYTKGDKEFIVNDKSFQKYFQIKEDQNTAVASMNKMKCLDKFRVTVIVKGGGHAAQAEAIRHGTARVLVDFNNNFRKRLRKAGFLTRDPRMRERKHFGLKRARKGPQWSKR